MPSRRPKRRRVERDAAESEPRDIAELYELAVHDGAGVRIGVVVGVCGEAPGRAEWLRVRLGLFGLRIVAIPLFGAVVERGAVYVPHLRDHVWDAPGLHDHVVSERMAASLRRHYDGGAERAIAG